MSYNKPSHRRRVKKENTPLNLVPILDAIFILIFFLLMSAQFVKIFEIGSDVPIVSSEPPPKSKKKPLALTLRINKNSFSLKTGLQQRTYKNIPKTKEGEYDLFALHDELLALKKRYLDESTIILEPVVDLTYEEIVNIMDAVRMLKKADGILYIKDKDGTEQPTRTLFHKIMFGNFMS